jgi:hypothetical protein
LRGFGNKEGARKAVNLSWISGKGRLFFYPSDNGANVHQWSFHGGDNQRWKLQDAGDGYYFLVARQSGKVLDVSSSATKDGDNVHQWKMHGGQNQHWRLQKQH